MKRRRLVARGPARAAWQARVQVARHSLGRAAGESRLRVIGLGSLAVLVLSGTFLLFRGAFDFLHSLDVVGPILLERLIALFFFILFVMLVMSNVLVAFQTLYRSREAESWATAPQPPRVLIDARGPEVSLHAGWAFVALGVPLLLAHAAAVEAHWLFLVLVPVVLVAFATTANAIGLLAVVALVRLFPGLDLKRLAVVVIVAAVPIGFALVRAFRVSGFDADADLPELLGAALEGLGRTRMPMLPGHWAAEALRAAAAADVGRAAFFTWSLVITATFLFVAARALADAAWREGFQQLRGRGVERPVFSRRKAGRPGPQRGPRRALAWKDARVFRRDPMQWSQVALVALLTFVYVVNLRHLPLVPQFSAWGDVAAALSTGVVMLLMATLATRFAYPLISLEGRRAWIVLLAPLPRGAIVTQKLVTTLVAIVPFGLVASEASARVLGVAPTTRILGDAVVVATAFAIGGLATGLGAIFPNFREDNPARIVAGFGGTLCFLLCLAHVVVVLLISAGARVARGFGRIDEADAAAWEIGALAAIVVISAVVGAVPLLIGRRRFAELEL